MRSMTAIERDILARLLAVDFEGVAALRLQAEHIVSAEPNCNCGCPSITPQIDKTLAPPSNSKTLVPTELLELSRADQIPRTVLCFLDADGYLANLECVYYDDALPEWPDLENCALLLHDDERHLVGIELPGGPLVRASGPLESWVSLQLETDGFTATTFDGYRDQYSAAGQLLTRTFVK